MPWIQKYARLGILAAAVTILSPMSVIAQSVEIGRAAYADGDYEAAINLLSPVAEQGNATAQFIVGSIYGNGHGVERNYALALSWYRQVANQGHAKAQYNVGVKTVSRCTFGLLLPLFTAMYVHQSSRAPLRGK